MKGLQVFEIVGNRADVVASLDPLVVDSMWQEIHRSM